MTGAAEGFPRRAGCGSARGGGGWRGRGGAEGVGRLGGVGVFFFFYLLGLLVLFLLWKWGRSVREVGRVDE